MVGDNINHEQGLGFFLNILRFSIGIVGGPTITVLTIQNKLYDLD